jgi:DNA polymerase-3 subunit alpha
MYFHTFIDANGDWLDTVFFPQTASRCPVTGKGFYSMRGKVVEEFGVFTVDVSCCKKVGIKARGEKANELLKEDKKAGVGGGEVIFYVLFS